MRGLRGVSSGGAKREKKLPPRGRNVEGIGYVVVDHGSERMVRCKVCNRVLPVAGWWQHGTSADPHDPEPR